MGGEALGPAGFLEAPSELLFALPSLPLSCPMDLWKGHHCSPWDAQRRSPWLLQCGPWCVEPQA